MVRAILGVIVGFIVALVVSGALFFGLWFALGVDGVLEKGQFKGTMALNIGAPVCSILGGLVGGLLCARIGRSARAVLVLAVLTLIGVALTGVQEQSTPTPGPRPEGLSVVQAIKQGKPPMWWSILNPLITAGAMLVGGRCSMGRKS